MSMRYMMFSIYLLLFCFWAFSSCQNEELASESDTMGYLSLEIGASSSPRTKSNGPAADYDPKKLHVRILNEKGDTVVSTTDWEGQTFRLKAGTYTVKASSNGFDGSTSCAKPYYSGSTEVFVAAGKECTAELTCTLANVMVTVSFDKSFSSAFQSAAVTIKSTKAGVDIRSYQMGTDDGDYFFPVDSLITELSVVNKHNVTFWQKDTIAGVKARDHYKLTYRVKEQGEASIVVKADDTERVYTFTFNVYPEPSAVVEVKTANAWSTFARLEGNAQDMKGNLVDPSYLTFEYRQQGTEAWTKVITDITSDLEGNSMTILKGLIPDTKYEYHLVYKNGNEEVTSSESSFTTESQMVLPNGKLDDWYQDGKTWDAISEADFKAQRFFWDSSNPGTTTGAGALVNVNPTLGSNTNVHTAGGKSAELKSQYASAFGIGKFAAASLYAGAFNGLVGTNGAKIDFGQPFTARPTQLTGWFQYSTGAIDYAQSGLPVGEGDTDLWSAYIVLTNGKYQLNNTDMAGTSKDFMSILESGKPDASGFDVIAYGVLSDEECVASPEWKQFTIDLTYRNLVEKPTHVIIVFSSSKYGDYFTGSTSSTLYLDDLELIYGDSPKLLGSE